MFVFLSVSTFIILFFNYFFFPNSYLGADLHSVCLSYIPQTSWPNLYKALVCGKRLPDSPQKLDLQSLGLIHLFVVSGAHLHFIDVIFRRFFNNKIPFIFRISLLLLYVAVCNFQISALRAWIQILLRQINVMLFLNFTSFQLLLASVFFCLLLFPSQFFSFSLILSWGACLGIFAFRSPLAQSFCCFMVLYPIINAFSYLSPWSILFNTFLSPVIALFLFPLTLLSYIIPFFVYYTDFLWHFFFKVSKWLSININEVFEINSNGGTTTYWFYILFAHFIFEQLFKKSDR